jgi:hypothetical protein
MKWFWIKTRFRVWVWNTFKRRWYAWRYPKTER